MLLTVTLVCVVFPVGSVPVRGLSLAYAKGLALNFRSNVEIAHVFDPSVVTTYMEAILGLPVDTIMITPGAAEVVYARGKGGKGDAAGSTNADPEDGDVRTFPCETEGDRLADALPGTGHECDLTCQDGSVHLGIISLKFVHNIRGRPGFDVVGSPAELQAEVPGRPPKTTGNQSKCEGQLRTRSRCLTRSESASLRARPVARVAASENGLGAEGEPIARSATPKDG